MERITRFLDGTNAFRYTRSGHLIEIWLAHMEELPVVVSKINSSRYIVSSGNLIYEMTDEEKAYRYILRVFVVMDSTR
ncbi:hypothetical protein [Parapedobacter sp. 10938]|uniref:hypothetical protein n=1 Tax=Parapedobacter flavus TaxID=3110225 RepID=UPI002DBE5002|nr:hypothetical protein [Parapedobacter sp. 10938]MEC3878687.1 hypothetical protein [Parapedobacter sp. 10938]